jgi:hypothetical protein
MKFDFKEVKMIALKTALITLAVGMAMLFLSMCRFGSDLNITKAEYVNEDTFIVYYVGDTGSRSVVDFTVEGKDKPYTIKSRSSLAILDTKVTCKLYDDFVSGDHITVTSNEVPGSAEFDVPDYQE